MAGAAALPLIATIGGTALQYIATEDAARKRNRQLSRMDADRERYGAQSRELTTELGKQYDPASRRQLLEQLTGAREADLTSDLAKAAAKLPEEGVKGRTSEAYAEAGAASTAKEAQRRVDLTRMLSKVLAPSDLRSKEGLNTADTASRQSILAGDMRGLSAARGADLERIRPDSTLMLGGALAQGAGQGLAYSDYTTKLNELYDGLFAGAPKKLPKVPAASLGGNL